MPILIFTYELTLLSSHQELGSHCIPKILCETIKLNETRFLIHLKPQGFLLQIYNSPGLYKFCNFYQPLELACEMNYEL